MDILLLYPLNAPIDLSLTDNEGAEFDYNSLTVVELKSIAENKGIKVTSTMKKVDIIQAILESEI